MEKPKIAVVGSINMDLVTEVNHVPIMGETIIGNRFFHSPGGKGANQAIACSKLGADVSIFGCVGDDQYGKQLIANLEKNKVCTKFIDIVPSYHTGIASITLQNGDNSIIVVPGANYEMDTVRIRNRETTLRDFDLILTSLEIPLNSIIELSDIAEKYNIPLVLNPAPACTLPEQLLEKVTILTPNEHELPIIIGENKPKRLLEVNDLLKLYNGSIVMTKGKEGAYYKNKTGQISHFPSYSVEVVDTTGAGDAFNGGLSYMLAKGEDVETAIKFAVVVGALAVTKLGAQEGLPTLEDCLDFIHTKTNV